MAYEDGASYKNKIKDSLKLDILGVAHIPSIYRVMKIASWQLNFTAKFHCSEIVLGLSKLNI